eukprot:3487067-Alexandrium_andersonii.AAC.1
MEVTASTNSDAESLGKGYAKLSVARTRHIDKWHQGLDRKAFDSLYPRRLQAENFAHLPDEAVGWR